MSSNIRPCTGSDEGSDEGRLLVRTLIFFHQESINFACCLKKIWKALGECDAFLRQDLHAAVIEGYRHVIEKFVHNDRPPYVRFKSWCLALRKHDNGERGSTALAGTGHAPEPRSTLKNWDPWNRRSSVIDIDDEKSFETVDIQNGFNNPCESEHAHGRYLKSLPQKVCGDDRPYCLDIKCRQYGRSFAEGWYHFTVKLEEILMTFGVRVSTADPAASRDELHHYPVGIPLGECKYLLDVPKDSDGRSFKKALGLLLSILKIRILDPNEINEDVVLDWRYGASAEDVRNRQLWFKETGSGTVTYTTLQYADFDERWGHKLNSK
eukprot:jgi/Botrbrau1/19677/Bobra.0003s0039.1